MKRAALLVVGCLVAMSAEAGVIRMIVADLPYERVWAAALKSVDGFPVEHAAEGIIATGWRERPPRGEESAFERVRERIRLRLESFGERITRVTVEVEAEGWREREWVGLAETTTTAREVLARLRDAQG